MRADLFTYARIEDSGFPSTKLVAGNPESLAAVPRQAAVVVGWHRWRGEEQRLRADEAKKMKMLEAVSKTGSMHDQLLMGTTLFDWHRWRGEEQRFLTHESTAANTPCASAEIWVPNSSIFPPPPNKTGGVG